MYDQKISLETLKLCYCHIIQWNSETWNLKGSLIFGIKKNHPQNLEEVKKCVFLCLLEPRGWKKWRIVISRSVYIVHTPVEQSTFPQHCAITHFLYRYLVNCLPSLKCSLVGGRWPDSIHGYFDIKTNYPLYIELPTGYSILIRSAYGRFGSSVNRLRQRYSSFYSGKILFDGQLWSSVGILPLDEINFFLHVANHYDLNF